METKHKKNYITPSSETMELKLEGMLCESTRCDQMEQRTVGGFWSGGDVWY